MKSVDPIVVGLIDNSPDAGRYTNKHDAIAFLKEYGVKLTLFASTFSSVAEMTSDYEVIYMTKREMKKRGFQGVVSANLMGLSSLHILDDFIFNHPVFGENYSTHTHTPLRAVMDRH